MRLLQRLLQLFDFVFALLLLLLRLVQLRIFLLQVFLEGLHLGFVTLGELNSAFSRLLLGWWSNRLRGRRLLWPLRAILGRWPWW